MMPAIVLSLLVGVASGALSMSQKTGPTREKLSLFNRNRPEDALYDRYALALAATERSRELRDEALKSSVGKWKWEWSQKFRKTNVCDSRNKEYANPKWRSACARHSVISARVIEAVSGLSVGEFNHITRVVAASPALKQKVMHQAYLYRVASHMQDGRHVLVVPPVEDKAYAGSPDPLPGGSLRTFATVAQKVELLRQQQRADLVAALGIDEFPEYPVCDQRVLPFMSPQVRSTCASFPKQAADLVRSYGVDFDTFERLLVKADKDPIFRWRLARTMRQVERERQRYRADEDDGGSGGI